MVQPTTREEQRIQTRANLLRVAAEEFDKRGYADVSLSDIAAKQGVTKGTVYFHFTSKAALASAVVDSYFGMWETLLNEMKQRDFRGIYALRWLSAEVAQNYRDDPGVRAPLRLMRESNVIGIELPTPFLPWIETVEKHLTEAQSMGELRPAINIKSTAWQVVAGFFGAQEISHQLKERTEMVERVDAMWDLLLSGIKARA